MTLISFCCLTNFASCQKLDSKIDSLYQVKNNAPRCSIAVYKGDEITIEKKYGIINLDYIIPVTKETVFDIGSIAKQFTEAAIKLNEGTIINFGLGVA